MNALSCGVKVPPEFWLLNCYDKQQYLQLQLTFCQMSTKIRRNSKVGRFNEALDIIRRWAIRGDAEDQRRCLACGILWFEQEIAINTQQLKYLLFKCKSSINSTLHDSGFQPAPRDAFVKLLDRSYPLLKRNIGEIRKWTLRTYGSPQRLSPNA